MLSFTDSEKRFQWSNSSLRGELKLFVGAANTFCELELGKSLTVTSIYRSPEKDKALKGSGLHTLWRAIDCVLEGQTEATLNLIALQINKFFGYGDGKVICLVEITTGTGPHLHFQVPAGKVLVP